VQLNYITFDESKDFFLGQRVVVIVIIPCDTAIARGNPSFWMVI
jgi:hypothetical protein